MPPAMTDASLRRSALVVVCLSSFVAPLMLSSVNVAIPTLARALAADAVLASWVATAYLLSSAAFLLPLGRLADMWGRKRLFIAGNTVVMLGSFAAATSPNVELLIAWRVLQGIGAAAIYSTGVALLTSIFPRERRGAVIGVTISAVYLGLTVGPSLGGWITHAFGWQVVFLYHIPLSLLCLALALWRVPGEWLGAPGHRFDWGGSLLYGAGVVAFMLGLSRLPGADGAWLVLAGLAGFALFFAWERRHVDPVLDVTLFTTSRVFAFSCLASMLIYSAVFANSFLVSLYLQTLRGMTPDHAGVLMVAQPLMQTLFSPLAGRLSDRMEPRVLSSIGTGCAALGMFALAQLTPQTPLAVVIASLAVVGFGFAFFTPPNTTAIMGSVEPRHYGAVSSVVSMVRVLGQMLSMAVATVTIALYVGRVQIDLVEHAALAQAMHTAFVVSAVLCLIALAFSLFRGRVG